MAPELDVGMSMGIGRGMGMMPLGMASMDGGASSSFSAAYFCGIPNADGLPIDDLLDFSHQDMIFETPPPGYAEESHQSHPIPSYESPAAAVSSFDASASNLSAFSDDLYVPSEEAAELEWLSKFVDDSFSDVVPFPSSPGNCGHGFETLPRSISGGPSGDLSGVPGSARSQRSRALQNPTSVWASPAPAQQTSSFSGSPVSSSSSPLEFSPSISPSGGGRKKETGGAAGPGMESGVRRCTHCSSEKTPQWRTGPLGPKTLCNACGVRYKSGRLVPEYRPAASPTFVLTQHSNSHRKVMELRRQKDLILRHHGGGSASTSSSSRPELLFRDHKVS